MDIVFETIIPNLMIQISEEIEPWQIVDDHVVISEDPIPIAVNGVIQALKLVECSPNTVPVALEYILTAHDVVGAA